MILGITIFATSGDRGQLASGAESGPPIAAQMKPNPEGRPHAYIADNAFYSYVSFIYIDGIRFDNIASINGIRYISLYKHQDWAERIFVMPLVLFTR